MDSPFLAITIIIGGLASLRIFRDAIPRHVRYGAYAGFAIAAGLTIAGFVAMFTR